MVVANAQFISYSTFNFTCREAFSPSAPSFRIRTRISSRRWLTSNKIPLRLEYFNPKCSIIDTDVLNHIKTDEEVQEDLATGDPDCSVPILHLQSNVVETDMIHLLAKSTYVDSLLTTLPVLTEEEQNILAANPAHPAGLIALYANCLAGNLVEQLWSFAWPVAIALLRPSLLPVAVIGFFTKLAAIVGGPLVGNLMDQFPRIASYNCLAVVQTAAQLLSVGMIIHAHTTCSTPVSSLLLQPWFVALVIAGAIERLTGLALGVAIERDWVVLLAGTNRPIALAQANAILSRIDLLCEIAGASLFGILLSRYEPVTCLKLAATLMTSALPVTIFLAWLTNKLSAGVLERTTISSCSQNSSTGLHFDATSIVKSSLQTIQQGWLEYIQQPVLPASLAYVLLNFNIVLSPGGLMTAFLTQQDLNPSLIGGFSGLCAFMGVAATFISARLVQKFGILKAGAAGLILQASLLTTAVVVYWTGSLSQKTALLFFLSLIILSRLGHMSYDVVGQQILQTGIPESKANLIGTTEVSVASLAESIMLGVAIVANDVSHFRFLAILSLLSVVGAAWLFCRWLMNPTETQRSLFAFDSPK